MDTLADSGILSELLASLHTFETLSGPKAQGELLAAALEQVPGVARAGICFRGSDLQACSDPCPALTTGSAEEDPAGCEEQKAMVLPVETNRACYAHLVLRVTNPEAFAPYEPFVALYARSLGLLLENHRQGEELEAARAEAARLFEKERALFVGIQEALLDVPQHMAGVKFGHIYRSATVESGIGGDFYDIFETKDGGVGLVIGDVCGRGLEAVRLATFVAACINAFSHQFAFPHHVLRETNRLLLEKEIPDFVTVFLGFLDPNTGILTYSSAGHPPPFYNEDGQVATLRSGSTPLGIFFDARYSDGRVALKPGQTVVMYTDGLSDLRNEQEFFGERGVLESIRALIAWPTEKLPSLLLERALAFSSGQLRDDVAVLAVTYTGNAAGER